MMLSRLFALLLLTTIMAHSQPATSAPSGEKAGIFSTRPVSSFHALLLSLAPGAKISEAPAGDATNFTCEWTDVTVRFTVRSHWNRQVESAGMKNWISSHPDQEKNTPGVQALLGKIDGTVDCVGSTVTPQYDPAGKASSVVLGVAAKLDGYFFSHQCFYDATGARIIGSTNAPAHLAGHTQ